MTGASIIEFKTDRPGDGSDADRRRFLDRHREQLEVYRSLIARRYDLDPTRIPVRLIRLGDALVMDLGSTDHI